MGCWARKRWFRSVASTCASRCKAWVASSTCSRPSTKPSGIPSASTAAIATASIEISSRRRIAPAPGSAADSPVLPPSNSSRRLVAALKPEAHAPYRSDVLRAVRVVPELAPQPRHVHVQGLGRAPPLGVPDLAHDLLPGDDLAGLGDHEREEVELLGRQLDLGVTEPGPTGVAVYPDALYRPGLGRSAPEQGPDPGQQLGQPERLGDIVVGAGVQADHGIDLVGACGQNQYRDGLAGGPNTAAHLESVNLLQADVENDDVGAAVLGSLKRQRTVGRHVHFVALTP